MSTALSNNSKYDLNIYIIEDYVTYSATTDSFDSEDYSDASSSAAGCSPRSNSGDRVLQPFREIQDDLQCLPLQSQNDVKGE